MRLKNLWTTLVTVMIIACIIILMLNQHLIDKLRTSVHNFTDHTSAALQWESCVASDYEDWFEEYAATDLLECAVINVPISSQSVSKTKSATGDTDNTTTSLGANTEDSPLTVRLAISRLPHSGADDEKLGTLIVITGGPGQSGLNVSPFETQEFQRLSKHFDIIGYAPRGVYPSTPAVKCDPSLDINSPSWSRDFAKACWENSSAMLLKHIGADHAIEDIEAIRQALKAPKISLIGYSYGTRVATLYAEKYPQYLRAGVLDGLMNINEPHLNHIRHQTASKQKSFELLVNTCKERMKTSSEYCYFQDTHTMAEAEAKMHDIFRMLEDEEIYDDAGERITTHHLWRIIDIMISSPSNWETISVLFRDIERGEYELLKRGVEYSNQFMSEEAFSAINCANFAPASSQRAARLKQYRQIDALSSWDDYKEWSDEELMSPCDYWDVAGSSKPHQPKLSDKAPPLLLVAHTQDSATPYDNATAMREYLGATLITRDDIGHTSALFGISQCIDEKVVDYLISPTEFNKQNGDGKMLYCD